MLKSYLVVLKNPRHVAFFEQLVLSGTTFLALLYFARVLPKDAWGGFSISIALFHFVQGFQRALITIPLVTFSPGKEATRDSIHFWLGEMHKITRRTIAIVAIVLLAYKVLQPNHWMGSALLGLLILIVPHFYYEFVRRCLIQLGFYTRLASISLLYAAITAVSVATAMYFLPSVESAAIAYASGAVIAALVGMWTIRNECKWSDRQQQIADHLDIPKFARWSLFSHFAFSSYVLAIPVILGFMAGPAAVAVLTAVRNIVQPLNTLLAAVDNVDKPKASRAWKSGGTQALMASLSHTRRTLVIAGGGYLIMIWLLGDPVLHYLYSGKYDGNAPVQTVWVLIYCCMLVSQPAETGLYIMRKPELLFTARAIAACLGLLTAVATIPFFGVMGAGGGLLAGWACNAIASQRLLVKSASESAAAS